MPTCDGCGQSWGCLDKDTGKSIKWKVERFSAARGEMTGVGSECMPCYSTRRQDFDNCSRAELEEAKSQSQDCADLGMQPWEGLLNEFLSLLIPSQLPKFLNNLQT